MGTLICRRGRWRADWSLPRPPASTGGSSAVRRDRVHGIETDDEQPAASAIHLTATWSKYRMMTGDTFPSPDAPGESRETEVVDALRPCAGIDDGGIDPEVLAPGMTPIAAQQRVKLTSSLVIVRAPPDLQ